MKDPCSTAGRVQQKSKEKVDLNAHTFIVDTLRLLLLAFMMNDIEDGLATIHGRPDLQTIGSNQPSNGC